MLCHHGVSKPIACRSAAAAAAADRMSDSSFDFDVAISFLHEDVDVARELQDGIGEALTVFVYTSRQEEVAGTDGLESFREVFRHRSRLAVVLLRDRWGRTPWTRVEMEAITDRFLKEGPGFLFVVMMDEAPPPPWIPEKLIRFNLKDFGTREAIGAIKARALEQGSRIVRPTSAFLAQRAQERAEFAKKKMSLLRSEAGVRQAEAEANRLMGLIEVKAKEAIAAAPGLGIEFGRQDVACGMKTPGVAVVCGYQNNIVNALDNARITIREWRGGVILPGEAGRYIHEPKELAKRILAPEFTREVGWGWRDAGDEWISSEEVATQIMEQFFALLDRQSAGKLPRIDW